MTIGLCLLLSFIKPDYILFKHTEVALKTVRKINEMISVKVKIVVTYDEEVFEKKKRNR